MYSLMGLRGCLAINSTFAVRACIFQMRIGNHEQFILLLEQPYKHFAIAIVFVFLRHDSTRKKEQSEKIKMARNK